MIRSARVAPDGQTILYGALWENNRCRVHTVRLDGPESPPLDLPDANILAISRSGDVAVALGGHEEGVFTYGTLAQVPLAGGAPRPDRRWCQVRRLVSRRPDSSRSFGAARLGDHLEFPVGRVLVAPVPGGTSGLGFPRVSPDGTRVAFVRYRAPLSLAGRVEIVDRSGATTVLSPEYLNLHGLCWRGNELVYTAADDRPLFRALRTVSPGGGDSRTIVRLPGNSTVWDTLPDGRLLLAQTDDHGVLMVKIAGDTSEARSLLARCPLARGYCRLMASGCCSASTGRGVVTTMPRTCARRMVQPPIRLGSGRALALSPDAKVGDLWPDGYWAVAVSGGHSHRRRTEPTTGRSWTVLQPCALLADGKRIIVSANEPDRLARLFVHDLPPRVPCRSRQKARAPLWCRRTTRRWRSSSAPHPAVRRQ